MTDRESIEILQQWNHDLETFSNDEQDGIEAHNIAISALQEQEERSKECTCWGNAQKEIKIANGETFCSMCGKPLKGV